MSIYKLWFRNPPRIYMQGTCNYGSSPNSEPGPLYCYWLWCGWLILSSSSWDLGQSHPHPFNFSQWESNCKTKLVCAISLIRLCNKRLQEQTRCTGYCSPTWQALLACHGVRCRNTESRWLLAFIQHGAIANTAVTLSRKLPPFSFFFFFL